MSQEKIFEDFFKIIEEKYHINSSTAQKTYPKHKPIEAWLDPKTYAEWIIDELKEAEDEMRENNSVYLEDELWDIFWDYLNMLYCLEKKWYITKENVFKRCEKKFLERTDALRNEISWNDIKKKQKKELLEEHNTKYNS